MWRVVVSHTRKRLTSYMLCVIRAPKTFRISCPVVFRFSFFLFDTFVRCQRKKRRQSLPRQKSCTYIYRKYDDDDEGVRDRVIEQCIIFIYHRDLYASTRIVYLMGQTKASINRPKIILCFCICLRVRVRLVRKETTIQKLEGCCSNIYYLLNLYMFALNLLYNGISKIY